MKKEIRTFIISVEVTSDATDKELLNLITSIEAQTEMIPDDYGRNMDPVKVTLAEKWHYE